MTSIPLEILHKIAYYGIWSYRALLAIPIFARSVGRHPEYKCYEKTIDYMVRFGCQARINTFGICWFLGHELHRIDGPAISLLTGVEVWYRYGERHRDSSKHVMDDPALTWMNGDREWWYRGRRHRDGAPAIINVDGRKEWYLNGELHSQDDQPAIERASGDKEWYCNGRRHRAGNKPAMEFADGNKAYYYDGKKFDPTERRRDILTKN
jgi:hypothetical protein